jgi:hypothetical protein
MSSIITLQNDVASELSSKESLRGVTVLTVDRLDIVNEINRGLAKLGTAAIVGTSSGKTTKPNSKSPQFDVTVGVRVLENVTINRSRKQNLFATVDDEAARLALTSVPTTGSVLQSDDNLYYWLMEDGQESDATKWAKLMTATEIVELVVRSLHFFSPTNFQTLLAHSYEYGQDEDVVDVTALFQTVFYLDPKPVP